MYMLPIGSEAVFFKSVNFGLGLTNIHFLFNQIFINWRTRSNRIIKSSLKN